MLVETKPLTKTKTIDFDCLYHVGTMNPDDKGSYFSSSYEGSGLSVSLDPDRWIQIARLGGFPTWKMTRDTPAVFVNYHELDNSDLERIKAWGESKDYFTEQDCYTIHWFDDELDEEVYMTFATIEQARAEFPDEDYSDDDITKETRIIATDRLLDRAAIDSKEDCTDGLVVAWAEDHGYDGVWWKDEDGPWSCARGTIFAENVSDWSSEQL